MMPPKARACWATSPALRLRVPLKSICSIKCETPVPKYFPSLAEPVLTTRSNATLGLPGICLIITVMPLSRVYLAAEPSEKDKAGNAKMRKRKLGIILLKLAIGRFSFAVFLQEPLYIRIRIFYNLRTNKNQNRKLPAIIRPDNQARMDVFFSLQKVIVIFNDIL